MNELEISVATLAMLVTRPLAKCAKHLKLLSPDDLATFKEHVEQKVEKAESLLKTLNEEDIPDNEKLQSLKLATEEEILAGYDVIVKINKIFENIEKEAEREEKRKKNADRKKRERLGF